MAEDLPTAGPSGMELTEEDLFGFDDAGSDAVAREMAVAGFGDTVNVILDLYDAAVSHRERLSRAHSQLILVGRMSPAVDMAKEEVRQKELTALNACARAMWRQVKAVEKELVRAAEVASERGITDEIASVMVAGSARLVAWRRGLVAARSDARRRLIKVEGSVPVGPHGSPTGALTAGTWTLPHSSARSRDKMCVGVLATSINTTPSPSPRSPRVHLGTGTPHSTRSCVPSTRSCVPT